MTNKLELNEILAAIDTDSKELWDEISEEERKELKKTLFILPNFVSNVVTNDKKIKQHYIIMVNELVNKNYFLLQKNHSKLLWQLLCACGYETKQIFRHKYLKSKKDQGNSKIKNFLEDLYPNMKNDEIEMLSKLMSKQEITDLAQSHGYDDKFIKNLFK